MGRRGPGGVQNTLPCAGSRPLQWKHCATCARRRTPRSLSWRRASPVIEKLLKQTNAGQEEGGGR